MATQHDEGAATVRDLVERAARGEEAAFDALIRLASDRLYAIAYRILRDQYLAEDALQQVLVTVWNELPRLRDPDRFDAVALTSPPCIGDTMALDRVLLLQFDGPIDAASLRPRFVEASPAP